MKKNKPNHLGQLIRTACKKQFLFIIGTAALVIVWYFQTFTIEKIKSQIDDIKIYRSRVFECQDAIQNGQFYLTQTDIHRKDYDNLQIYHFAQTAMITNLTGNYCAMAEQEMYLEHGEDTTISPSLFFEQCLHKQKKLLEKNDSAELRQFLAGQATLSRTFDEKVLRISNDRESKLTKCLGLYKSLSIALVIIGTILISLNKAREFLLMLPVKS